QDNTRTGTYEGGMIIAPNKTGAHIYNNIIKYNIAGLYLANSNAADPAQIRHNVFLDNNNPGGNSGRGIYSDSYASGGNLSGVVTDDNVFTGNTGALPRPDLEAAISLESVMPLSQSNISITNNAFNANGKAVLAFNVSNMLISMNDIGHSLDTSSAALRFEGA